MKIIKYIFFLLMILIIVGSVYLATLDGSYNIKRERLIEAPAEVIFNDLNDYKNWKEWGPWYEEDSTIVENYPENTIGEGAYYTWSSKDGDGEMRTLKVVKNKQLNQEITFKTPFGDMKSVVYWILSPTGKGTNLTWGMQGEMGFFSRWMAKGMENQIGPMEERGLTLFDLNIQKKLKIYHIESNGIVDYSGGHYLYTTISCRIEDIGNKFPELINKVGAYIKSNKIRTTGGAFSLYHKFDKENGTAMFSVGYPVSQRVIPKKDSDILSGFMERGKYFKTTLTGSYTNSPKAWEKAMSEVMSLKDFKMIETGEPFELYVNNPVSTLNPADLITEIYIPVIVKD